jgi:hypothetical protein
MSINFCANPKRFIKGKRGGNLAAKYMIDPISNVSGRRYKKYLFSSRIEDQRMKCIGVLTFLCSSGRDLPRKGKR